MLTVSLFFLSYCIASGMCALCYSGWVQYEESCYGFGTSLVTWGDAQAICRVYGATLATVETEAENAFLKKMAQERKYVIWIGATDIFNHTHWEWASTRRPLSFMDWGTYDVSVEPNNRPDEDCASIHKATQYRWADLKCQYNCYFVCEKNNQTEQHWEQASSSLKAANSTVLRTT